jgi:hypothetical protein
VNKRELLPPQIIFTHQKEKKRKRKEEKKGYTLQTAREVAAVKVFWQNTTRSETRCGDCGKNP